MFDRSLVLSDDDRVAFLERPVEVDREISHDITQNFLQGEGDGEPADAQAADDGGDVDAQILKQNDADPDPDGGFDEFGKNISDQGVGFLSLFFLTAQSLMESVF